MTAGDSLFHSRDRFSGSDDDTAEIEGLRDVTMATNFGTKIGRLVAIVHFVRTIATKRLVMEGV